ncbi:hypothetical protein [Lentibacillus amyloliquefaciens]|uniref:Yip1 domain-containing protein n=1 Tax=Lentibacillus amyloliquefaciens TaxID=1472767 RepID=A0A0U3WHL5_9BACI|nr:hypothetical protein [Lentibacillus amyloliquefaciens]ALX49359.1 hypothetical protein AOX59_12670 [Lentibacillus amyloliquefaciens]
MLYRVNLAKFFFPIEDHLYTLKRAETLKNLWKLCALLVLASAGVYAWMAILGIGSDIISSEAAALSVFEYEAGKVWFVLGRMTFAAAFALLILFIPSLFFYAITEIPYKKLLVMQQIVFLVMLIERVLWIPLAVYAGLDWFASPWAFGIITSYFTDLSWVIFFFGAISLFQLWIIWFQVKFVGFMSDINRVWLWVSVIGIHILDWAGVSALAFLDSHLISGWFG